MPADSFRILHAKGMRRLATSLLVAMGVVFVIARALETGYPAWSWLRAFAEAALVGGLADWFAVTALFRRPLQLPIPHTAIVPANKDRIGDAFADFLERHFLTRTVLAAELAQLDCAALIVNWLLDPVQRRWLAAQSLHTLVAEQKPGPLLADWLDSALAQGLHQRLFDQLMDAAAQLLDGETYPIYRKVSEKSPPWMPRRFNDAFYVRLIEGLDELLIDMRAPGSEARQRFTQSVTALREQLAAGALDQVIARQLQEALAQGLLAAHAEHSLAGFARRLAEDPQRRERLNRWARRQVVILLARQRRRIVGLVRRVVHGWDPQTVAARLERYVGRDLQYIRINGTLVGGLVGLLLHGAAKSF